MPRVFSKRFPHPPGAVLVDRTTDFGNPFKVGKHGDLPTVLAKYEEWIYKPARVRLRQRMKRELRGKDLLCWCSSPQYPMPCHAHIILKIANEDRS